MKKIMLLSVLLLNCTFFLVTNSYASGNNKNNSNNSSKYDSAEVGKRLADKYPVRSDASTKRETNNTNTDAARKYRTSGVPRN